MKATSGARIPSPKSKPLRSRYAVLTSFDIPVGKLAEYLLLLESVALESRSALLSCALRASLIFSNSLREVVAGGFHDFIKHTVTACTTLHDIISLSPKHVDLTTGKYIVLNLSVCSLSLRVRFQLLDDNHDWYNDVVIRQLWIVATLSLDSSYSCGRLMNPYIKYVYLIAPAMQIS